MLAPWEHCGAASAVCEVRGERGDKADSGRHVRIVRQYLQAFRQKAVPGLTNRHERGRRHDYATLGKRGMQGPCVVTGTVGAGQVRLRCLRMRASVDRFCNLIQPFGFKHVAFVHHPVVRHRSSVFFLLTLHTKSHKLTILLQNEETCNAKLCQ